MSKAIKEQGIMVRKKRYSPVFLLMILFVCLALVLTGCSRRTAGTGGDDDPENTPEAVETETPSPEATPTSSPDPSPDPVTGSGLDVNQVRVFMDRNHQDENVLGCFIEDFDRDGSDEAVVVAGSSDDDISGFYVLRLKDGILSQVGELSGNDNGYSIRKIEPVRFPETDLTFICVELTNWVSLSGFAIYEIYGEGVLQLFVAASPTGAGEDALLDLDDDGIYDGFYQRRWSYDVFYYPIHRQFLWIDGLLYPDICDIELPGYPDAIEGVITEYLILSTLALENCPAADDRMAMLCPNPPDIVVQDSLRDLYHALSNEVLELDEGLGFEISQEGDSAEVRVYGADYYGQVHEFTFSMVRKDYGWCIESIN